jgi:outer membrane receptor protein involved in Fe transport
MLEYYFEPVGLFSVGVFRRDTENFFGTTTLPVHAAFLSYYNLNPAEFGQHQVLTNYNIPGTVRMDGIDFNYKQALTFLPEWARGLQVFANGSAQHKTGDVTRSFNGVTRMANWGVTYARDRLSLRMNWNLRPHEQGAPVIGRGIAPETYIWTKKRLYTDLNGDYRLTRRFSIFFSARNLFDTPEGSERIGPSTPSNARLIQYVEYGALWTLGVKGTF